MDGTKIKFGDKIFVYGVLTDPEKYEDVGFENPEYNTVMGYTAVGGFDITPEKTPDLSLCLPGFVVDMSSLAPETLFAGMELVDVTQLLTMQTPVLSGTRVWMPIRRTVD